MFAGCDSYKSVKSSHIVGARWRQWLSEGGRCSLRFALWPIGRTGTRVGHGMPMVRLVAGMQRMRSVHD